MVDNQQLIQLSSDFRTHFALVQIADYDVTSKVCVILAALEFEDLLQLYVGMLLFQKILCSTNVSVIQPVLRSRI